LNHGVLQIGWEIGRAVDDGDVRAIGENLGHFLNGLFHGGVDFGLAPGLAGNLGFRCSFGLYRLRTPAIHPALVLAEPAG
jgi:hypothetical protein